jgi:hypothetical protein
MLSGVRNIMAKSLLFLAAVFLLAACSPEKQESNNAAENTEVKKPEAAYVDEGVCPFEGCTYREWIAQEDNQIHESMDENSPVIFTVKKGEKVTGITGTVLTTQYGEGEVLKDAPIYGGPAIKKGDRIQIINHVGEGYMKIKYNGQIYEAQILVPDPSYDINSTRDNEIIYIKETQKLETEWWVKIKNSQGQEGWTKNTNFANMDSLG